ncbi:MAG TPA: SAM-dependent chlorinase/fluorinase [Bacteroidales bacterium]|nr:SAM-dependent chlorinase/fluorinase [Bacteroidales bacterium]
MAFITLTTEWRESDFFHGILRGRLATVCPEAIAVTNASGIPPFNITHGSFVIRNTFSHYPEGTVHLIFIHSESSEGQPHIIVKAKGHWFIGADNGIFNLILNSPPDLVISLDNSDEDDEITLFVKTAAAIIKGTAPDKLGKKINGFSEKVPLRATIDKNVIIGSVIFIDSYGNAITNITREIFARVFDSRDFRILIKSNKYFTEKISRHYSDEPVGELVTRFNSVDLLEVSINGADMCQLFGVETGDVVRVEVRSPEHSRGGLFNNQKG